MPSSKNYKEVEKFCLCCGNPLVLVCARDIERKNFCSRQCANAYTSKRRVFEEKTCRKCGSMFQPTNASQVYCTYECNKSEQVIRSYRHLNNNPEKYFQHLLYKKGRELLSTNFLLSLLEKQDGMCAISGQKLTFTKIPGSGRINTNASIDQIEAGGGYTEDNVQLVCDIVNRMKIDLTLDELNFWCKKILED